MISLSGINKNYGEQIILRNFNLHVSENEFLAIVGPSGSGKSTILNILGLLDSADSGTYRLLNNTNIKIFSNKAMKILRYNLGYLFQNFGLVNDMTVFQNMKISTRFANYENEQVVIMNALKRVGLDGFDLKKVYQLSGGEQQRLAIARLMVKPCQIILADEPTGNLDDDNKLIVFNLLLEMKQLGKTVIVVTHDPELMKIADRVVTLTYHKLGE